MVSGRDDYAVGNGIGFEDQFHHRVRVPYRVDGSKIGPVHGHERNVSGLQKDSRAVLGNRPTEESKALTCRNGGG